ncbi:hypothetical protein IPZ58_29710 [Streptomyces roseoverticillatus]|uniref:hypothetical protein n=1 Tax=Streptomyces roseoverticillatus TaxID=66429 RepID=UPI001F275A79|nr:hypothetical protein [Streptomyces roseoverticillatus]MCF3105735.1 hypothetical protein [Streptomyces roseoverticillatus]
MADSALTGLVGALGGALIGGGAAILGPLLLKRKERHQAVADNKQEQADDAMKALIDARMKTRLWLDYLVSTVAQAAAGVPIDRDAFEARAEKLGKDAVRACYRLEYFDEEIVSVRSYHLYYQVIGAMRNSAVVIKMSLATGAIAEGHVPNEVMDVLTQAEQTRTWFRLASAHLTTIRASHP